MRSTAPCLLAALLLLPAGPVLAQSTVHGTLVDASSGARVPRATVVLSANRGRFQTSVQTDADGRFAFEDLAAGPYRLRAARVGYREVITAVQLAQADTLQLEIRIGVGAVALEPVTVVSRAEVRPSGWMRGFHDRMERGVGHFITREEVEQRRPAQVTDLLRAMPGMTNRMGRWGIGGQQTTQTRQGSNCIVQIFLDGMLLTRGFFGTRRSDFNLDDYVQPSEVEGIEIYRGGHDVPAEFMTPNAGCGTVVIWTRRGR
ncbi:MAG TPA: TonB-dependent receptor [Longimicrobium sp.]|nr:TonB-dependent receptor [Longimicrobium sp.]